MSCSNFAPMPDSAENYSSQLIRNAMRSQALWVWGIAALVVLVWTLFIIAPPILIENGLQNIASPVYSFFSYICHQKPERSFHIHGHQFTVCSRCFGVYFGLLLGVAVYPLWRVIDNVESLPRFWLFLSLIPISIDWSLGVFGIWENNHASRVITGLILGFGCAVFIVPAVIEIVRNLQKPDRQGGLNRHREESPP